MVVPVGTSMMECLVCDPVSVWYCLRVICSYNLIISLTSSRITTLLRPREWLSPYWGLSVPFLTAWFDIKIMHPLWLLLDVSKPIGNRIPLLLECGHTFCEGCITKWARLQKTQVLCPECTYSTPLTAEGEKGVRNIPTNIYLLGVMTNTKRASFRRQVQ